jgi:hypothetical protein
MFFLRLTAAAGLAFALGACTLVPRNAGQGLAARTEPAPGTVSEAGPGDTVITRTSAAMRAGLLLEAPVAIRFYTLQPGFYPLVGEDDTHLFFDAPREDGCPSNCGRVSASRFADTPSAIRIPRPGTGFQPGERSEGELCVVTAYDYRLCGSGAHALIERAADPADAILQALVFEGAEAGGALAFTFTESRGGRDTIRSGRPLSLPAGTLGRVRVAEIELDILEAGPARLVYAAPVSETLEDPLAPRDRQGRRRIDPLDRLGENEDEPDFLDRGGFSQP